MLARLVLEDGAVFPGRSIGARGSAGGEVVFTTAMTGYEEVLSDPSYRGQVVTMAYPLIGNYGISGEAWESRRVQVRALWERVPIFGICLGHQIIGRASGAETFKLPYGHRGSNQPVQDLETGRVCVTTQNHGYAVDDASLGRAELRVTHRNLNDGTVEGLRHLRLPIVSIQYHPEGRPGPQDSAYLFDEWLETIGGAVIGSAHARARG